MQTPLVSVILPVYNRKDLFPRTLKSIVNQTYGNLEVLVIDDGSSEDLKSVTDSFKDPRIKYLRHNVNKGVAEARNTGLRAAKGEFIAFLDSDDEYLPKKTEKQVEMFHGDNSEDGIGAVYCAMLVEKENTYRLYSPKVCKWNILLQQTMVRKQFIDKAGFFDTDFVYAGDTEYIYRLKNTCRFASSPEPLVIFHNTHGSHSKNIEPLNKCTELFIRKYSNTLLPEEKSKWFYYIGNRYIHIRKTQEGYKSFLRSYIAYPLNERALRKLIRLSPLVLFHLLKNPASRREEPGTYDLDINKMERMREE